MNQNHDMSKRGGSFDGLNRCEHFRQVNQIRLLK
jgi:hypothetical protein